MARPEDVPTPHCPEWPWAPTQPHLSEEMISVNSRLLITDCYVPETHSMDSGTSLPVRDVLNAVLDPAGAPRDGVTVSGGEPFLQAGALRLLLQALKALEVHTVVYSGHTLDSLARRPEPEVRA